VGSYECGDESSGFNVMELVTSIKDQWNVNKLYSILFAGFWETTCIMI
jgi:hypothetical protein